MLSTGFALAILTTAGAFIVFTKLPKKIRQIIIKYHLLTDVLTLIGVYFLLGGTLTALFAAALCGLAISLLLHVANNEEKYLYLYDLKAALQQRIQQAQDALNQYGSKYRQQAMGATNEQESPS